MGLKWLNCKICFVKGYIAEEVLPEPIVPVIKKFWYSPFSGINTFLLFNSSKPINKCNSEREKLFDNEFFLEILWGNRWNI